MRLLLAVGLAIALLAPAYAADPPKAGAPAASAPAATPAPTTGPQKFGDEAKATAFCKSGNVVWFNPESKIYFPPGSQFYGKTKAGGYTCKAAAEKQGYRATKGN